MFEKSSCSYSEYAKNKTPERIIRASQKEIEAARRIRWDIPEINVEDDFEHRLCHGPRLDVHITGNILRMHKDDTVGNIHADLINRLHGNSNKNTNIKKVIFNPPATIVLWTDNTKTVVKAQNDEPFDPEKGLAMAIVKKTFGNQGNYFNEIKKWTEGYSEPKPEIRTVLTNNDGIAVELLDANVETTTIGSGIVDAVIDEVLLRLKTTKI